MSELTSQNLSEYQWENRLLLVFTADTTSPDYQQQLKIWKSDPDGIRERKLKLITVTPNGLRTGTGDAATWEPHSAGYTGHDFDRTPFEVQLIGLDGGVKHRQQTPVTTEKLFGLIDRMPMRRAEMRRNKQ